jgi:hypothetical protein
VAEGRHAEQVATGKLRFEPEVEDAMRAAYRMVCEAPHLTDMGGAMIAIVAEKIVEIGRAGETDPNRLYVRALQQVTH